MSPLWRNLGILSPEVSSGRVIEERTVHLCAWGYKRRQFFRCKNCGSVTHYESARKRADGSDWLTINVRNIDDPESVARLPIKMLDGASSWKVLGGLRALYLAWRL